MNLTLNSPPSLLTFLPLDEPQVEHLPRDAGDRGKDKPAAVAPGRS